MKRRASPVLIGAFVVAGLAVLTAVVIALAGGELFKRKERAVLHFSGSIYGLQVGAPVVFRGVRVGSVVGIEVLYDSQRSDFFIPVLIDLERDAIRGIESANGRAGRGARGHGAGSAGSGNEEPAPPVAQLVERGLRAQLSMQSLLTGLLYVDLDMRPDKAASVQNVQRGPWLDAIEIPTTETAIQTLKNQLDGLDIRRIADDLSAIASSARALVSGPELKQALADIEAIVASAKRVMTRLEKRIDPLANSAGSAMASVQSASQRLGAAADGLKAMSDSVGTASDRLAAVVAPDSPLVQRLNQTAAELAGTAVALRAAAGEDSRLMVSTERTLADLSRAARALRELAETLENNPEALLRGKARP
jgi:paraquat-inducible protein B